MKSADAQRKESVMGWGQNFLITESLRRHKQHSHEWIVNIDYVFSFKASFREFTLDLEEAWVPFLEEYLLMDTV